MRSAAVLILLLSLAVSLLPTPVQATQIIYRSPKQMGQESALVVSGRVSRVRSFWNERHTKILTETIIEVDRSYKGSATPKIRLLQLGGVVGKVKMTVHGALSWRVGEEVLLFLDRYDERNYRVAGFSQGKFSVGRDPVTGKAFVRRPALEGAEVLGAPGRGGIAPVDRITEVPLDEFIDYALGTKR